MLKTLLICDDSTGANASAILLNKIRFKTLSAINQHDLPSYQGYDALAVSTDSRAVDSKTAKSRVFEVLKQFEKEDIIVINKRIDSTLRGNLGSELNAFIEVFKKRKIAIVPAFPKSGRTCLNGRVYVNGVSLENTDVARDPKMPITTSDVYKLFKKQFNGKLTNIFKQEYHNISSFKKQIINSYKDFDGVIFDAETNEDIDLISKVLVDLNIAIITVDPGVFTFYYTRAKIKESQNPKKYLYLVGSVTDTTYNQISYVKSQSVFDIFSLNPLELLEADNILEVAEKTKNKLAESNYNHIIISTFDLDSRVILDLFKIAKEKDIEVDEASKIINTSLAKIATYLIENIGVKAIFSSGGDTTLSFLLENNAKGIELIDEVMPLCVYGKVVEGKFNGMPIITKGGMIGNQDAYLLISEYFEEETNE